MSKLTSLKNQTVIADKCVMANSHFEKAKGLLGKREFSQGEGMFFPRCNNIHMWFMQIPIDVVFVAKPQGENGVYKVTSVRKSVKPWRFFPVSDGRATETVELPVGTVERCDICAGDELCIS